MRTTLEIDDDVLEAARSLAHARRSSLGKVLSDLARRGLAPVRVRASDDGLFPTFQVEPSAAPITSEAVAAALDEL